MSAVKKISVLATGVWAALVMGLTGCASGGFKLTRQYAGFVNGQNIIIRIILYILTLVVFVVTVAIDLVINNTLDFWDGRVSQGTYKFEKNGETYVVQHSLSEKKLRSTHIAVSSVNSKAQHQYLISETDDGKIEVYVDGKLKAKVDNIQSVPLISFYDQNGRAVETREIDQVRAVAQF